MSNIFVIIHLSKAGLFAPLSDLYIYLYISTPV